MATVTTTYSSLTELVDGLVTSPNYRDYFDDWRAPYEAFVDAAEGFGLTFDGFGTGTVLSGGGPGIATWTITGSNLVIPGTWTINTLALTDFGGGSLLVTAAPGTGAVKFNTSTTAMSGSISAISYSLGSRSVELQGSGPATGTANFTVKHLEINDSIAGGYQLILESTGGVAFNNNSDSPSFMKPISGNITSIDLTIGSQHLTASGISISAVTFYNADTEGEITAIVNSIFGGNNTHLATENDETLLGGGGADTYDFLGFTPGTASELANGGTDLVKTQFSYELDDNIENATVTGAAGASLTGNGLSNKLTGGTGNDTLIGGLGKDTLAGGAGDDSYTANLVNLTAATLGIADTVGPEAVGGGIDTLLLTADGTVAQNTTPIVLLLGANIDNLSFSATTNPLLINATGNLLANQIIGNNANNLIKGEGGDDLLVGANGADTLDGGIGSDSLTGGGDNDTFLLGQAGDIIVDSVEGGGIDTVLLGNALNPFRDLSATELDHVRFTGTGAIALTGNGGGNTLTGGAGADTLDGGTGGDTLTGGGGNDRFLVDSLDDQLLDSAGIDTVEASVSGWVLGTGFENLVLMADGLATGNAMNNVLTDGEGSVTLQGLAGNDSYYITADDAIWEDTLHGGAGNDKAFIALDNASGYHLDEDVEAGVIVYGGDTGGGYLIGNASLNIVTGDDSDDTLDGGLGNDTLVGGAGNDQLEGGDGKDSMAGGAGNDVYYFNLYKPAAVALPEDTVMEAANAGTDTLVVHAGAGFSATPNLTVLLMANVENLDLSQLGEWTINATGNLLHNVITGNGGNNKIDGGAGNDSLDGGGGADSLLGGAGNDTVDGGDGNDLLDGGLGNDTYYECNGDDIFVLSQAGDSILIDENTGVDTALISATGNTAYLNITGENDFLDNVTFTGTAAVTITGNGGINVLKGGGGADTIDGGAGADSMVGGAGNDLLVVDSLDDAVDGGLGTDVVRVDVSPWYILQDNANVETLLLGTTGTNVMGNESANRLTGNDAANILWGGGGNDTVTGGAANDTFVLDRVGAGQVVRITDFSSGNDRIGLFDGSTQFVGIFGDGIAAGEVVSNATGAGVGIGPQLVYNSTTGNLYYDLNGATAGGQTLIAVFDAAVKPGALSNTDFTGFSVEA